MAFRKNEICIRCSGPIRPEEPGLALVLLAQTLGMGKRKSSKSERIYLCSQCAVVTAMGDSPSKSQPINAAAYRQIRGLVATQSDVVNEAWKELNRRAIADSMPQLPEGEVLPPARSLKAAG
jgi:hypothetical protein